MKFTDTLGAISNYEGEEATRIRWTVEPVVKTNSSLELLVVFSGRFDYSCNNLRIHVNNAD